jgi:hypothetical protein
MSFDDVARRMQQRHSEGMVPNYEAPPLPPATPNADAFAASLMDAERRSRKNRDLVLGSVLLGLGLLITLVTYDSASQSGGTYVIAYGPMVVGAIRLFRGLAA